MNAMGGRGRLVVALAGAALVASSLTTAADAQVDRRDPTDQHAFPDWTATVPAPGDGFYTDVALKGRLTYAAGFNYTGNADPAFLEQRDESGRRTWKRRLDGPHHIAADKYGVVVVTQVKVTRVDVQGKVVWSHFLDEIGYPRRVSFTPTPVIVGGRILIVGGWKRGHPAAPAVAALDQRTGAPLGVRRYPGHGRRWGLPAPIGDGVVVVSDDGTLARIDSRTLAMRWSTDLQTSYQVVDVAVWGQRIHVALTAPFTGPVTPDGDEDNVVVTYDGDGVEQWQRGYLSDDLATDVVATPDGVVVLDSGGLLTAMDTEAAYTWTRRVDERLGYSGTAAWNYHGIRVAGLTPRTDGEGDAAITSYRVVIDADDA